MKEDKNKLPGPEHTSKGRTHACAGYSGHLF